MSNIVNTENLKTLTTTQILKILKDDWELFYLPYIEDLGFREMEYEKRKILLKELLDRNDKEMLEER